MEQAERMPLEDKVFSGDPSMTGSKNKMLIRDTKKELMRYGHTLAPLSLSKPSSVYAFIQTALRRGAHCMNVVIMPHLSVHSNRVSMCRRKTQLMPAFLLFIS